MIYSEETISVIIPVYKAQDYLEYCVKSVLSQTYTNLEVILVDDKSPDGSGAICDRLALQDSRIKVLHARQNGGQSASRNKGLGIATGRYISFVDDDDCIAEDMYERLYALLKEHSADISICSRKVISDWYKDEHHNTGVSVFENGLIDFSKLGHPYDAIVPWGKMFKREVWKDVRFPEDLGWCEDIFILPDYLKNTHRSAYTSEQMYYYSLRYDNTSFKIPSQDRVRNQICSYLKLYEFYKSHHFKDGWVTREVLNSYMLGWNSTENEAEKLSYRRDYINFFKKNIFYVISLKRLLFVVSPKLYDCLRNLSI